MNFRSLLGISVCSLAIVLNGLQPTHAATLTAGSLIKASGSAVYYFSQDGKRYAFPDQSTYNSWYTDFSNIQTLTDSELAQVPFGGIVTIRPGSRMVKITTDPRVYAVARGGVLRWVQTETLARALYGETWNRSVSDVPDAFFTNYRIQTEIALATDFSSTTEQVAATTIDLDLRARMTTPTVPIAPVTTTTPVTPVVTSTPSTPTTTPVTPTSTSLIDGRLSILTNGPYNPGDIVTVLGAVTRGFIDRITLGYGTSTVLATCTTSPCRGEFMVPNARVTSTLPLRAIFTAGEGRDLIAATTTAELVITPSRSSSEIHVTGQSQVVYGNFRQIRVDVDPTLQARAIKLAVDDIVLKECDGVQWCNLDENETARVGSTRTFYAIVTDSDYKTVYSDPFTFQVVR